MVFEGFEHGAAWFVGVGAVGETAAARYLEQFREVARYLFWLHVERAEALDARCVDEPSSAGGLDHLAVGGGVHACVVGLADGCRPQVESWHEGVQQGRLPYAAVAAEDSDFRCEELSQLRDAFTVDGRGLQTLVADGRIDVDEQLLRLPFLFVEQVGLVEEQYDRHAVGFGRSEEAVDEGGACLRVCHRYDEYGLVDVGSDDVALLAEV